MEGQTPENHQQECKQGITGKFSGGDEGAVREDSHTEDPPLQVQGIRTYRRGRKEVILSS